MVLTAATLLLGLSVMVLTATTGLLGLWVMDRRNSNYWSSWSLGHG